MADEERPTVKALQECAVWLQTCLGLGWPRSSLDELERLWWQYHDAHGRLIADQPSKNAAAVTLGRKGGSSTSARKARASRENGKRAKQKEKR